jgi:hypothetical protein
LSKKKKTYFYKNIFPMSTEKKEPTKKENTDLPKTYEIPVEGSLGLLALGAAGIRAWRKKREEVKQSEEKKKENNG